ncbi:MAG: hypothetical protein LUE98_07620 [Tannerellaceae bacterium]|nr:hypothetical protein [Tannerellaceae bacterium]
MKKITNLEIENHLAYFRGKPNAGFIVKTKSGHEGYTKHSEPLINGKQRVYIEKEGEEKFNLLCNPDTLIIIGFID